MFDESLEKNNVTFVTYLLDNIKSKKYFEKFNEDGLDFAASAAYSGNIDLFETMVKLLCPFNDEFDYDCQFPGQIDHSQCMKRIIGYAEAKNDAVANAIRGDHLDMVRYLVEHHYPVHSTAREYGDPDEEPILFDCDSSNGIMLACKFNRMDILIYLVESGDVEKYAINHPDLNLHENRTIYPCAVEGGYNRCIDYLLDHGYHFSRYVIDGAIETNNFKTLKYLIAKGCQPDEDSFSTAVKSNSLEMIEYLRKQGCPFNRKTICKDALKTSSVTLLQYTHRMGGKLTRKVAEKCIGIHDKEKGLQCLQYYYENGGVWTDTLCKLAYSSGKALALDYLIQNNCPWVNVKVKRPSNFASLEVVLKHKLVPSNELNFAKYVGSGGVKSLKLLLDYGVEWKEDTLKQATSHGDYICPKKIVDGFKFALENGCPWNLDTYRTIIRKRSIPIDLLKLIFDLNLPRDDSDSLSNAVNQRREDKVDLLLDNGIQIDGDSVREAERIRHYKILKIFREKGAVVDEKLFKKLEEKEKKRASK